MKSNTFLGNSVKQNEEEIEGKLDESYGGAVYFTCYGEKTNCEVEML